MAGDDGVTVSDVGPFTTHTLPSGTKLGDHYSDTKTETTVKDTDTKGTKPELPKRYIGEAFSLAKFGFKRLKAVNYCTWMDVHSLKI